MVQVAMPRRPEASPVQGGFQNVLLNLPRIADAGFKGYRMGKEIQADTAKRTLDAKKQVYAAGIGLLDAYENDIRETSQRMGISSQEAAQQLFPQYQERYANAFQSIGDRFKNEFPIDKNGFPSKFSLASEPYFRQLGAEIRMEEDPSGYLAGREKSRVKQEDITREDKIRAEDITREDKIRKEKQGREDAAAKLKADSPTNKEANYEYLIKQNVPKNKARAIAFGETAQEKATAKPTKATKRIGAMTDQQRYKNFEKKALGYQTQLDTDENATVVKRNWLKVQIKDAKREMRKLMAKGDVAVTLSVTPDTAPKPAYSQADLEATAQKYGITVEEVKRRLESK